MDIAIISDTHMPRGGRRLPEACLVRLRASELIVHAGDLVSLDVLKELKTFAELAAVHGNVDDRAVRAALPASRILDVHGVRLGLVHDAGPARGRSSRMRAQFPGTDAVVFGHSHIPLHDRAADGFQIFNPGSPTERRRAPRHTMGVARVDGGKVRFELIALG